MPYIHEQTGAYPCNDRSIRDFNPNVTFPAVITLDIAAGFGFRLVVAVDPPAITSTQRLGQGRPQKRADGQWYQTWVIQDMSAEEVVALVAGEKEAACGRIEARRLSLETAGVWINWPDGERSKIQTRDERDWRNINGVAARGLARLMQGLADDDWFRDADDKNHTLLPTQAVDMGYQAASAISAIAKVAQDAKDAIRGEGVTTLEQVAAIEAGVVWPA